MSTHAGAGAVGEGSGRALSFTAIDVQTANGRPSSVCGVGMVRVRDGEIVDVTGHLVRPLRTDAVFTHAWRGGIQPRDVATAPAWPEFEPQVRAFTDRDVLVAHGARYHRAVLGSGLSAAALVCTRDLARARLRGSSAGLPSVAARLGLPVPRAEHPEERARCVAQIVLTLARRAGVGDLRDLCTLAGAGWTDAITATGRAGGGPSGLDGEVVCFVGRLRGVRRSGARELVRSAGGRVTGSVSRATTLLVAGDLGARGARPGGAPGTQLAQALGLAGCGWPVRVVDEAEFLRRAGEPVRRAR